MTLANFIEPAAVFFLFGTLFGLWLQRRFG